MTFFTALCATTSVALGAIYMFAAGAPRLYIAINLAALAIGLLAAPSIKRGLVRYRAVAGALIVTIGVVLIATALFGVHIDGASRWIRVAGLSLQPSLMLLPLAIMLFAGDRSWLPAIGMTLASLGLGMQPDRAMSGTLVAGLIALWVQRREPSVAVALAGAIAGFVTTMVRSDVVPPVLFVEQVVQSAFAFHVLTGLAIVAGLMVMMAPAVVGVEFSAVSATFGALWLAVIVFSIVGNYPTPLVGYGSSAILGYCLSAAMIPRTVKR